MIKPELCKTCKRPLVQPGKRNKNGELPYQINLEISEETIKNLRKGSKSIWFITDKKKIGYCEVQLKINKKL